MCAGLYFLLNGCWLSYLRERVWCDGGVTYENKFSKAHIKPVLKTKFCQQLNRAVLFVWVLFTTISVFRLVCVWFGLCFHTWGYMSLHLRLCNVSLACRLDSLFTLHSHQSMRASETFMIAEERQEEINSFASGKEIRVGRPSCWRSLIKLNSTHNGLYITKFGVGWWRRPPHTTTFSIIMYYITR